MAAIVVVNVGSVIKLFIVVAKVVDGSFKATVQVVNRPVVVEVVKVTNRPASKVTDRPAVKVTDGPALKLRT